MIKIEKLGNHIEFQRGYDLTHDNMIEGPYPVVGSTSVIGYHSEYKAENGITLGRSGTVGIPRLNIGKYWPHNTSLFTTDLKGNDLQYLYYLLINLHIDKLKTGSTVPTLNRNDIYPLEVPFEVDVNEQRKVSTLLSMLDQKINVNYSISSTLESLARDIYNYWFVQFDFPDENGKPYKSSGGKMVWNEELKREIPEGWEVGNINTIADILPGGTPSKAVDDYWKDGLIPFFGPTDYQGTVFQLETKDHITKKGLNACASSLFDTGTIIITARGSIGKLVIVGTSMAMNQSCYAFKPYDAEETPYLYYVSKQVIEYLKVKGSGSVFKSIITDDIEASMLPIGSKKTRKEYCAVAKPIFDRIATLEKENQQLASLRDFLLPMLMNGQVKVESE